MRLPQPAAKAKSPADKKENHHLILASQFFLAPGQGGIAHFPGPPYFHTFPGAGLIFLLTKFF
jgi:hypothetical protein